MVASKFRIKFISEHMEILIEYQKGEKIFDSEEPKYLKNIYHPCGVLVVFVFISLLSGFFIHPQGFTIGAGLGFVLVIGMALPWITLKGIDVSARFSKDRVYEKDLVEVEITLKNYCPWPSVGLNVQIDESDDSRLGFSYLPSRNSLVAQWNWRPSKRGVYPQNESRLCTGFPFGIWEYTKMIRPGNELIVWPEIFPVGPVPLTGGEQQVDGNVSRRKVGTHGDIVGVRPYRRGDSPKRIHWAQTARHEKLVVCELESCSRPYIQIILDNNPAVHCGEDGKDTFEWSLRVAASFAKGWLSQGADIGIACSSFVLPPSSNSNQQKKILDALAACKMSAIKSLDQVVECQSCKHLRDGLKVIITTDRVHSHASCVSFESQEYRWVILETKGFLDHPEANHSQKFPKPWLLIKNPKDLQDKLAGGWMEAIHGT